MRRKKTDRQKMKDKADTLAAWLCKRRDGYRCQNCGTQYQEGDRGIECSHIVPRGYMATRWHPLNLKTLCTRCHLYWWHSDPTESDLWANEFFGAERLAFLNSRRLSIGKYSVEDLRTIVQRLQATKDAAEMTDIPILFPSPYPAEMEVAL